MSDDNQPFDLGSALARIGNIPTQDLETKLGHAAQDEGAAYRGRLAEEQSRAPEAPSLGYGMVEPVTQPKAQPQPPYDYSAANLESGRNLSRQSFVDSYNKQAAAEPWVDTLNRFASSLAGRPASPYNANPSNYRQLSPSEEAEKYRSEQSEYASLAAGIATPELASATGLARFAPGPNQVNMGVPLKAAAVRDVDPLGYYSQALEAAKALPQAKGTPEQMLAQLKKAGVKDAEIQATNLPQFLEGKRSVTRDELAQHLEDNRVALSEVQRNQDALTSNYAKDHLDAAGGDVDEAIKNIQGDTYLDKTGQNVLIDYLNKHKRGEIKLGGEPTSWQEYSLDPDNPTYRETTLHLPPGGGNNYEVFNAQSGLIHSSHATEQEAAARAEELRHLDPQGNAHVDYSRKPPMFQSGHFPEPSITGHLMTSMVEDNAGRKVFNVDQIQSDWGQKIREGGILDEAKVARVKREYDKAHDQYFALSPQEKYEPHTYGLYEQKPYYHDAPAGQDVRLTDRAQALYNRLDLLKAEWQTAAQGAPGHPLVNTTDQWTNTTLRHALRQAVESGADAISIPSGKTVLSYNPGNEHGMEEFYNKIVPKNLGNILKKIDPSAAKPEFHDQMITRPAHPSQPASFYEGGIKKGNGFTVFPLTDKIKKSVMEHGQPLFKRGGSVLRANGGSISDGTRALLAKVKRQDGGQTSAPQGEADIPTIDPAPLIPKSVSDLAPNLSQNVTGTPYYGGTLDPFQDKDTASAEPLMYAIPYLGLAKAAERMPAVARTLEATEEAGRVPGLMQYLSDQASILPDKISQAWHNGLMSSKDRENAVYEAQRTKNAELYKLDPQGYLQEVISHATSQPTGPGEAIQRDEYLRGVPQDVLDNAYRYIQQTQRSAIAPFQTVTTSKNEDRLTDTKAEGGPVKLKGSFQGPNLADIYFSRAKSQYPDMVPASGTFIPKNKLQPDDPNGGNFRALGTAFRYNVPPDARESTNIEDRTSIHPSMPTSSYVNYTGPTIGNIPIRTPPIPTSAAGVQGMPGTPSGPALSVPKSPWTANTMTPSDWDTQVVPSQARGGVVSDKMRAMLAKLIPHKRITPA